MHTGTKEYINDILFTFAQKLPAGIRSFLSKQLFPPMLENKKNIKLYGYSFFEPGVKIGTGTYIHSGAYLAHISIGRYCRIAKTLNTYVYIRAAMVIFQIIPLHSLQLWPMLG